MKKCISYSLSLLFAFTLILSVGKNASAATDTWNIRTKKTTATSSSPYFTPAAIDNACNNCVNEIGAPAGRTSQCDICKTLTVTDIEITTYDWFDTVYLILKIFIGFIVIGAIMTFAKSNKKNA